MTGLDGRVVVVTGAGRGLGREYARFAAAHGAALVVNDTGGGPGGDGADPDLVRAVAAEIRAEGGQAVASADDVRTRAGAEALLATAIGEFGAVHGLVTNAGVLRDRMFVNMSDEEWDDVIDGQLRTTFATLSVFTRHWRDLSKAGEAVDASVVTVSSTSGLIGAAGQSNYGAAKAGIAAMSIILAGEVQRYGIRVNSITPVARTRMTQDVPAFKDLVAAPSNPDTFDVFHPANVAPLVAWLLSGSCTFTGRTFYAKGAEIREFVPWQYGRTIDNDGARWTLDDLDVRMKDLTP